MYSSPFSFFLISLGANSTEIDPAAPHKVVSDWKNSAPLNSSDYVSREKLHQVTSSGSEWDYICLLFHCLKWYKL